MGEHAFSGFLASFLAILVGAKVFGELAERWGQPPVLGELVGGVVLGALPFGLLSAQQDKLAILSELGVLLLLFKAGLESDLDELLAVGPASLAVAAVGVALPFALGWAVMTWFGYGPMAAIVSGAALTATSIGITARVLADLGQLDRLESRIILGAAVIDDIIGIVILSAVQSMASSSGFSWAATIKTAALAGAFLLGALWAGRSLSSGLMEIVKKMKGRGVLIVASLSFAFAMALLAERLGTALIVGAFTGGILLARTDRRHEIDEALSPIAAVFVPVFFVLVGAQADLGIFNVWSPGQGSAFVAMTALTICAIGGKLLSGWAVRGRAVNRWAIGVGMVPRGEVGLIFAQAGLAGGLIDPPLYTALVGMVMATTFAAPPLLKRSLR